MGISDLIIWQKALEKMWTRE